MQTIQSWASGGKETKTGPNETGVTTMGMEAVGLTDATIVQDTTTGIQDIVVTDGRMTGMTDIEKTLGRGRDPPGGGLDPEKGIARDGDGLKTE